jgi:hypothetical protein
MIEMIGHRRVGLAQLVRFTVVELILLDLTWMLYLRLITLLVKGDVPVDSETLLVTDFVNLKIKPAQSFKNTHSDRVCAYVFIGVNARMYMSIYICIVFLKKYLHHKKHALHNKRRPETSTIQFNAER